MCISVYVTTVYYYVPPFMRFLVKTVLSVKMELLLVSNCARAAVVNGKLLNPQELSNLT